MSSLQEIAATLPECAQKCIASAAESSTCAPTDIACFCKGLGTSPASACIKTTCSLQNTLCTLTNTRPVIDWFTANLVVMSSPVTTNTTMTLCGVSPKVDHSYVPILSVFIGLAAIFVVLRFLARLLMKMKLWWDDWFNFAAMTCCIAFTAHGLTLKAGGWGTDIWAVPWENLEYQFRGYYIQVLIYVVSRLLIRISYILFYLRVFEHMARRLILITLATTIIVSLPLTITAFFQCTPVDYYWRKIHPDAHGTCINGAVYIWVGWSILLVNDLWVLFLPIPLIYKLQLSLKKKIMASVMFMVGVLITATSVYKFSLIKTFTDKSNPTINTVIMFDWLAIEIDLSVICACLPCIPVLFRTWISRHIGTSKGSNKYANGYAGPASHYAQISGTKGTITSSTDPVDRIRMTTTIHQQLSEYNESEANLPGNIELQTRPSKARANNSWE
ncbi:unnamed protein product [Clonostachys chloroleuca]|uniref:CFEM domain-containing protein n=1 Tax=Clonostachys chloroleuca TaxID=1926264 RepID=A0AA35VAB2_9HYPO|nr:unnamed protein product [Clonostachys chloroleuca]